MERLTYAKANRGTIIQSENNNELFLIIKHSETNDALICLDRRFSDIAISSDEHNLRRYYIYDTVDMDKLSNFIITGDFDDYNWYKDYNTITKMETPITIGEKAISIEKLTAYNENISVCKKRL